MSSKATIPILGGLGAVGGAIIKAFIGFGAVESGIQGARLVTESVATSAGRDITAGAFHVPAVSASKDSFGALSNLPYTTREFALPSNSGFSAIDHFHANTPNSSPFGSLDTRDTIINSTADLKLLTHEKPKDDNSAHTDTDHGTHLGHALHIGHSAAEAITKHDEHDGKESQKY